jgi:hypothetical protein
MEKKYIQFCLVLDQKSCLIKYWVNLLEQAGVVKGCYLAISLRNFLLFGKRDSDSIQKVESILLDGGVPQKFLVT